MITSHDNTFVITIGSQQQKLLMTQLNTKMARILEWCRLYMPINVSVNGNDNDFSGNHDKNSNSIWMLLNNNNYIHRHNDKESKNIIMILMI